MIIERYSIELRDKWNSFVEESRNGTFLFNRGYMDYHSDRFEDFSLIMRDNKGNIIALLPANREGDIICSHRGLTYGGWILGHKKPDANIMNEGWDTTLEFLRQSGISGIEYRPVPHIYHRYPAEEDLYGLLQKGARILPSPVSSVIDLKNPVGFNENSRRGLALANRSELTVRDSSDFRKYWEILSTLLKEKHSAKPVHTVEEIELLASRFPHNITLRAVFKDNEMIAGTVLFHCENTVKCQYIASSPEGQHSGALAFLFNDLMNSLPETVRYLDAGTSNRGIQQELNAGLLSQKAGFGARAVIYPRFILTF